MLAAQLEVPVDEQLDLALALRSRCLRVASANLRSSMNGTRKFASTWRANSGSLPSALQNYDRACALS